MTTQRARSHELEDRSLAALRLNLPSKWVIHEFRRDYGIDVQIEVFDELGMATGLRAYGQLKATDYAEGEDRLSLDRDHFEYWSSHSDPVLLLRYYDATNEFRWCWLHDVAWSMKPGADSLSVVRFLRPWSRESSASDISKFLRKRGEVLASRLLPPFTISILSRSLPLDAVMTVAQSVSDLVGKKTFRFLSGDQPAAAFEVFVEGETIATTHLGAAGIVVTGEVLKEDLPSLVLLLIFVTACRYDRILVARILAQKHFACLERAAEGSLVATLAEAMTFALGLKQASVALKPFSATDTAAESMRAALTFMGMFRGATRFGELAEWAALLSEAYQVAENDKRASVAYSCGNALFSLGRWGEAVTMFQAAANSDESYLGRPYFLCELAGSLFESGQYQEAERNYRLALDLEDSPRTRFTLGDALFCQGKFSAARDELQLAINTGLNDDYLNSASLIVKLCTEMIDGRGLPEVRQTIKYSGEHSALDAHAKKNGEDFERGLSKMLSEYGSDGLFNFNAAHMCRLARRVDLAMFRYFHCAARERTDSEAWAQGIAASIEIGDIEFTRIGIVLGYFYCGERVLSEFLRIFQPTGLDAEARVVWQGTVARAFRRAHQEGDHEVTVRLQCEGEHHPTEFKL